jgi:hypothetical protein
MRSTIHNVREQVAALRATLLDPSPEGVQAHALALEAAAASLRSLTQESAQGAAGAGGADPRNDSSPSDGSQTRGIATGTARLVEAADAAGLRRELEALAAELRVAGGLIDHGMAFQQGWAHILAAATAGYRPNGEPSPLSAQGSVSVRG